MLRPPVLRCYGWEGGASDEEDAGAPGDVGEAPSLEANAEAQRAPWYTFQAAGIAKICHSLQLHLLNNKLLQYCAEWCETQKPSLRAVACTEAVMVYDQTPEHPVVVSKDASIRKRVYVGIPHKLYALRGDSVLASAMDRVQKLYRQTF